MAHDDRLDSLAMAVNYWVEQMARDVDQAVTDEQERCRDEALRHFMEHTIGYESSGDAWMSLD